MLEDRGRNKGERIAGRKGRPLIGPVRKEGRDPLRTNTGSRQLEERPDGLDLINRDSPLIDDLIRYCIQLYVGEAVVSTREYSSSSTRSPLALIAFLRLLPSFPSSMLTHLIINLSVSSLLTVVGIIAGPYVTGGFNPRAWGGPSEEITTEITLEITRVVLALSVRSLSLGRSVFRHLRCSMLID
jgi:hypothetical protein